MYTFRSFFLLRHGAMHEKSFKDCRRRVLLPPLEAMLLFEDQFNFYDIGHGSFRLLISPSQRLFNIFSLVSRNGDFSAGMIPGSKQRRLNDF